MSGQRLVVEKMISEGEFADEHLREYTEERVLSAASHRLMEEMLNGGKYAVELCKEWSQVPERDFFKIRRFRATIGIKQIQTLNYREVVMGRDDWAALPRGCWWCRFRAWDVNLRSKAKHLWPNRIKGVFRRRT